MNKKAVICGCDTLPVRSLNIMLQSVGYDLLMLTDKAMDRLKSKGYTGGVWAEMLNNMGYVPASMPAADERDLLDCDLYLDIKRKDADSMIKLYPRLEGKTAVYLINGGGDDYVKYGDYYPTITNNMLVEKAFKCWTPFDNVHNIQPRGKRKSFDPPMGLLHNAYNWGFGSILDRVIERTGLRVFGSYDSPMGIITNDRVGAYLNEALCFVHMKASDCPGFALYEAFASATPVVVTDLFIERMKYHDMYVDGLTCLTWGKGSYEVSGERIVEYIDKTAGLMVDQIADCVRRLKNPKLNHEIGMEGHERWKALTEWTDEKRDALHAFLKKNL